MSDLSAQERIVLAIDTPDARKARQFAKLAADAGVSKIKFEGHALSARNMGPAVCAAIAKSHKLGWIADVKAYGTPHTITQTLENILVREHLPFAITIPTDDGEQAMKAAQALAGGQGVRVLGVTILSTMTDKECNRLHRAARRVVIPDRVAYAAECGLSGVVVPANFLKQVANTVRSNNLDILVPGTRSGGTTAHEQREAITPGRAITDGATWLVIGRQVTEAWLPGPARALNAVIAEVQAALPPSTS